MFVVITEPEAARVKERNILDADIFDHKPTSAYFKFFESSEEAMYAALIAFTPTAANACLQNTVWYCLRVDPTDEQWLKFLLDRETQPHISRGAGKLWKQFNVYGSFPLNGLTTDWSILTLAPIGIDAWARKNLSERFRSVEAGTCGECDMDQVPIWLGSKHHLRSHPEQGPEQKGYCAACWHQYFLTQFA